MSNQTAVYAVKAIKEYISHQYRLCRNCRFNKKEYVLQSGVKAYSKATQKLLKSYSKATFN